jgi:hypothetical protein
MSSDMHYGRPVRKSPVKLIAVQDEPDAEPLNAILVQTGKRRRWLIEWWGGYASQTLSSEVSPEDVLAWPGWRSFTLELPADWEEGYLRSERGDVQFVYGKAPSPRTEAGGPP